MNKLFVIIILLLTSCTSNMDYVHESKKVISLTIWANEQSQNTLDELMTQFKLDYPNINFEISIDVVAADEIFKKLETKPKYKPDVFIFDNILLENLVEENYIINNNIFKLSSNKSIGVYPKTSHKKEALLLAEWLSNNLTRQSNLFD